MSEEEAYRDECGVRFDLIPPEVLIAIAKVFAKGAKRYGDDNWKKSRLKGEHGPINHALKHIVNYSAGIPDEDGPDLKIHLAHAIVNLCFEYFYEYNKLEIPMTVADSLSIYNKEGVT